MERRILDPGVLIGLVRGRLDPEEVLRGDVDAAIPAVAVAEYLAGTLLDPDPGRQSAQRAFLDEVLKAAQVCNYDRDVAECHATLLAHTRGHGRRRGPHDLIIAATALAAGRVLVTTDAGAAFDELPGLGVRLIASSG